MEQNTFRKFASFAWEGYIKVQAVNKRTHWNQSHIYFTNVVMLLECVLKQVWPKPLGKLRTLHSTHIELQSEKRLKTEGMFGCLSWKTQKASLLITDTKYYILDPWWYLRICSPGELSPCFIGMLRVFNHVAYN